MGETRSPKKWRAVGQVSLGAVGVALVTSLSYPAHLNLAIPAFLCLLVVVLLSLSGGFIAAAIVSVAAVACLDYFFIPPVLAWRIRDPINIVVLLTFWLTGLVITRLASKARKEALAAESKRRDMAALYDVASRLLSLEPELGINARALGIFREVFHLDAVCLFDAGSAESQLDGRSAWGLAERTRKCFLEARDYRDDAKKLHIRCVRVANKLVGAMGFEGHLDDESPAGSLSLLAATALERTQSFERASKATAAVQAEMLRSAILDALAHEFKTPLAVILAVAGGLRETRGLDENQLEMAEIIETETSRLSHLMTRLLRMARLDRDEVSPKMEPTTLDGLVTRVLDQYSAGDRTVAVKLAEDVEVVSDPELLTLALVQLLDNAVKYSRPGTIVAIELDQNGDSADICVTNEGYAILPEEEDRIFERFYRGLEVGHLAPGSGLGLYFARKIVRAQGGTLDLAPNDGSRDSTTFRIRLPIVKQAAVV